MSITTWEPWSEMITLRDAMDRLLAESFIRPRDTNTGIAPTSLAVDVREKGDDFVVTAPIPGISPDDVDITVLGDMLRIRGERKEERQEGGGEHRWILREQRYGAFERSVRLPSPVKADKAKAEFRDGMLMISLPKTEEAKERRIPVSGSRQMGQATEVPIEASTGSAMSGKASKRSQPQAD